MDKNIAYLVGTVTGEPVYDHSYRDEYYYLINLAVRRQSGAYDYIPVMVSEETTSKIKLYDGVRVEVEGSFRSFNLHKDNRNILRLYVLADIIRLTEKDDENNILLNGYICKQPIYRKTPLGRKITDIIVAINRHNGKSDYIPVITWARKAGFVATLNVGDKISIDGRIQSRTYSKCIGENQYEDRTCYEVSAYTVKYEECVDNESSNEEGVLQ